ncbi:hypothetical protein PLESTB_000522200 [Pleodorina starrii]|uniref:Centrosomal protein POC5 n=1 Tax=Pleodorina starrii TaxID=330485 RepID=A0A9W6BHC7_9CHLO|nr:hypothetical protein PLESTB_000522200 [Pleodorina starrii]
MARAPAAISRTNVPLPAEPAQQEWAQPERAQPFVQLQPNMNADGSSSIDILVPVSPGGVSSQPSPTDGLNAAGNTTRPQTPTTLNIIARPPGGAVGQMEPAAVEITISTQPGEAQYEQQFVSHLQGLTVQQMLDLDIDALVVKIDEHHSQAKKAVLDHFMETKARMIQAKNEALEEEKSKAAAKMATKEEELNLMKAEADTLRIKSQRLWDVVSRTCTAYSAAKERSRTNVVLFQAFCAWRQQALALARRRRMVARAERWDANMRLKRNVFRAWFREAMRAHRITVNNRYIAEVDNAKRLIHEHYQRQIADMERMLADAHLQLEREAEARSKLEEDMKRAFMRGVCALNIEAMNMMKRGGAAPGATNPPGPSAAAQPPVGEQQQQEPVQGGGSSAPSTASGYSGQGPIAQVIPEASTLDPPGSITFSPPRFHVAISQGGAGGAGSAGTSLMVGATASSSGQPPVAGGGASVRMPGSGASTAGTVNTALTGGSSRPGSSYGLVTAGAAGGVGGRAGVGLHQSAVVTAPGQSEGGVFRETAQTFFQRPGVVVTRGPGVGLAASNADAPRPRATAPLPSVRML